MNCIICNEPADFTASCGCRLHLRCVRERTSCPSCEVEWSFTSGQWDEIYSFVNSGGDEEDDEGQYTPEDTEEFSTVLDQMTTPGYIRNQRIEHKVINVDENGKPKIIIVTIPRRYTEAYLNRLVGPVREPRAPQGPEIVTVEGTQEPQDSVIV